MKNRCFLYGYEMRQGQMVVCKAEAETLIQMFNEYINGLNLKEIAEMLESRKIEYLPGETGWNKSRIKRMIEDIRYLGDEIYPAIISQEVFQVANATKDGRRRATDYVICKDNKELVGMICCGRCGTRLYHRTDNRKKNNERWHCSTPECDTILFKSISDIEVEVVRLLNSLICNPSLLESAPANGKEDLSIEITRMNNEIERMLDSLDCDKDAVQNLILQCAAKKYDETKSAHHITERLKADFEKMCPLSVFSPELLERTVERILIDKEGTVRLVLKDGNVIGKE